MFFQHPNTTSRDAGSIPCHSTLAVPPAEKSGRLVSLDYLRILCTLGVIIIHVTSNTIDQNQSGVPDNVRLAMEFFSSVTRWCVPVFFVITGLIFLGLKSECTYRSIRLHLLRFTLVLLVIATGFCALERYYDCRAFSWQLLWAAFLDMLHGNSWAHMWYVYRVFLIYFFLPILRIFFSDSPYRGIWGYGLIVGFFSILMPILSTSGDTHALLYVLSITSFVSYVFLGGVLFKYIPAMRQRPRLSLTMNFLVFLVGMGWIVGLFMKKPSNYVAGYTSVPVFLITASVVTLFLLLGEELHPKKWLTETANCCWGIYLFHQVFINIIFKLIKWNPAKHCPLVSVPLTVVLLFLVTEILVFFARKIPFVRKYFL